MFKTEITRTPFSSLEADLLFPNITGVTFNKTDVSFLSTLRALVGPRISKAEKLLFSFSATDYLESEISSVPSGMCESGILGYLPLNNPNTFHIHSFEGDSGGNDTCMSLIGKYFADKIPQYSLQVNVVEFFARAFSVLCYTNTAAKSTLLFVTKLSLQKYHALQAGVYGYFPWFFNKKDVFSEDETELLNTFLKADGFPHCIKAYERCASALPHA